MQILRPWIIVTQSNCGMGPKSLLVCFVLFSNKASRWFWCTLNFEDHCIKRNNTDPHKLAVYDRESAFSHPKESTQWCLNSSCLYIYILIPITSWPQRKHHLQLHIAAVSDIMPMFCLENARLQRKDSTGSQVFSPPYWNADSIWLSTDLSSS